MYSSMKVMQFVSKKPLVLLLSLIFAGATSNLAASETVIRLHNRTIPAKALMEVTGEADMSKDNFARKVGITLANYSAKTKHEACAILCRGQDGSWGAAPFTIEAHSFCPVVNKCPDDMVATEESIHSHPTGSQYKVNAADIILLGPFAKIGALEKRGAVNVFSQEDFSSGPGYMITDRGELFYQNGYSNQRKIIP